MRNLLGSLFKVMPFLFGLGFLAPLISQGITLAGWTPPGGLSPLILGLLMGGGWGAIATRTGRWL